MTVQHAMLQQDHNVKLLIAQLVAQTCHLWNLLFESFLRAEFRVL